MDRSGRQMQYPWLKLFWDTCSDAALWVRNGVAEQCNRAATELFGQRLTEITDALKKKPGDHDEITLLTSEGRESVFTVKRVASDDPQGELVILRDVTEHRELTRSLEERNGQLLSTLESIPFDFWMNDTGNHTILQNTESRRLWGDQTGHHLREVTDDPTIIEQWENTNSRALNGETVVGEITYTIDGINRIFRNVVAPVRAGDEIIGILGFNLEISDLKLALEERDNLLKELHHLVRNDLQIILSAMNLHMSTRNLSASQILNRVENQIHAICLVHDQLYTGGPLSTVDLADFTTRLVPGTIVSEPAGPVLCVIEQAIPVAILLTELLWWVAGSDGARSRIDILRSTETDLHIVVSDPDGSDSLNRSTPGEPAVVRGLVEQLQGTLTLEASPRLRVAVTIPLEPTLR